MGAFEVRQHWTFTDTGGGAVLALGAGSPLEWSFLFDTVGSSRSTAAVQVQSAIASTGHWAKIGSTSMSSAAATVLSVTGPHAYLRPYVTALGSTVTPDRPTPSCMFSPWGCDASLLSSNHGR